MDGFRCVVPGCGQRAMTVDYFKRRRDGGAHTISLCDDHDRSIKGCHSGIFFREPKFLA
jgi:hypothetical protein